MLRRRRYDLALTTLTSTSKEAEELWAELGQVTPRIELIALTPEAGLSVHRADKSRLNLFALLGTPIDAVELYGTLRRLIDRLKKARTTPDGDKRA